MSVPHRPSLGESTSFDIPQGQFTAEAFVFAGELTYALIPPPGGASRPGLTNHSSSLRVDAEGRANARLL